MHETDAGSPPEAAGHEVGSEGQGRVCCSRLVLRRQKPEQDEGVRLVKAIYTMYKLVNQSAPLAASSPGPGASAGRRAPVGKGRLLQQLLGTGGGGGSADGASQYKNMERIL